MVQSVLIKVIPRKVFVKREKLIVNQTSAISGISGFLKLISRNQHESLYFFFFDSELLQTKFRINISFIIEI